jgi:2,4-dienoyl-CoA reductase-like NADH-dependent reductase (Old Yellow Enzyme family)
MSNEKTLLFDEIRLGPKKLHNRFVVAPMTRKSASPEGVPTAEMRDYYSAFAQGGFSMVITEGIYTDELYSKSDPNQPGLTNEEQVQGWKQVVDHVHKYNTVFIAQLMHAGVLAQISEKTIGPSAVQPIGERATEPGGLTGPFPVPKQMDDHDFREVLKGFVNAAVYAQRAGFDGVEIHAANGYLFDQFITAHTNTRTDRYGGNIGNSLRFLMEVFQAIKKKVKPGFIIGIRLSESKVNDLRYRWPEGSVKARQLFEILKDLSADYFHLAAEGGNWARECLYADGSSSSGIAKQITGVPVIANGGLHNTSIAASLISGGHADLVSIGRAAIANPDLPKIIASGEQLVPFRKEFIKPSLTLNHTREVLAKLLENNKSVPV